MADTLIQGHLDKGCGFYSILNAISEVNGMNSARSLDIFDAYARKYPEMVGRGYVRGLYFSELKQVVNDLIEFLDEDEKVECSFPFVNMKFETVGEFADKLRGHINASKGCAILGFGFPWPHWTAAKSVSDCAFILKDSTFHKRKMISALTLATNDGAYEPGTPIHSRQTIIFKKSGQS